MSWSAELRRRAAPALQPWLGPGVMTPCTLQRWLGWHATPRVWSGSKRATACRCWLLMCWLCLSACFVEHPCTKEICDAQDNDCDGLTDEDFIAEDGLYLDAENCGACGIRCAEVLPSAQSSECVRAGEQAQCRIVACPEERSRAIDGACVAAVSVGCLPCTTDEECLLREPYARCLRDSTGSKRCFGLCGAGDVCDDGFSCRDVASARLCMPSSGACECSAQLQGARFACELLSPGGSRRCPGQRTCSADALSECAAALSDTCNHEDDDCDGRIDEGFIDEAGRYVHDQHCGACGAVCAPQGPHMLASCEATFDAAQCTQRCEAGFVDRDGHPNNGCECQLGSARVPLVDDDSDCDGVVDATPPLVFVSPGGDDANSGTEPGAAVRSMTRGMQLGAQLGRTVVVGRGVYRERLDLIAGVSVVGGYSPDFRAHDSQLYPVWIEAPASEPGLPVLRCMGVTQGTYVADLTVIGSDARDASQGSTSVLLAACSDALELHGITVIAARGANGQRGLDSSARLSSSSGVGLAELAGVSGGVGSDSMNESCAYLTGGAAGEKRCGEVDVSGGQGGAARCAALSCSNSGGAPCGNAGCSDFTSDGVCDIAAARAVAQSNPDADPGRGNLPGRAGEPTFDAPTNHGECKFCDDNPSLPRAGGDGGDGRAGDAGKRGEGCSAEPLIDARGLVQGAAGGDAGDGQHGSGGGGGTAGAGYAVIAATSGACSSVPGAAGGGGGSAGCGAPAAAGGGGGGASIGIVIRLAAGSELGPVLDDVRIVTASGGDAGDGGIGAAGGAGGSGGLGGVSTFWCARNGGRGGDGGAGGDAGGGGGGCGGSSFGIFVAYDNAASVPDSYASSLRGSTRVEVAGHAGRGGRGGFSPSHAGADGNTGQISELALQALGMP